MINKIIGYGRPQIGLTHPISFGYVPDPPEPEETECTDEYIEGSCECCDHFEQCKQVWKGDEEWET